MRKLKPLSEDLIRADLARALHGSHELHFVHRLHAVLLVGVGRSCPEVAHWFGANPRSVERWVHAYELHGSSGLLDHQRIGRPTRLTKPQAQQLALELAGTPGACGYAQPGWSGKLVARHIERRWKVQLSVRHCQRLVRQAHR